MKILLSILLLISYSCLSAESLNIDRDFIHAIHLVESNGRIGGKIVGDNGASIGSLQIQWACWKDATDFNPSIGGTYKDCHNLSYSIKIFNSYLTRYEKNAILQQDFEALARCWNGGPNWRNKKSKTDRYWIKVRTIFYDIKERKK